VKSTSLGRGEGKRKQTLRSKTAGHLLRGRKKLAQKSRLHRNDEVTTSRIRRGQKEAGWFEPQQRWGKKLEKAKVFGLVIMLFRKRVLETNYPSD